MKRKVNTVRVGPFAGTRDDAGAISQTAGAALALNVDLAQDGESIFLPAKGTVCNSATRIGSTGSGVHVHALDPAVFTANTITGQSILASGIATDADGWRWSGYGLGIHPHRHLSGQDHDTVFPSDGTSQVYAYICDRKDASTVQIHKVDISAAPLAKDATWDHPTTDVTAGAFTAPLVLSDGRFVVVGTNPTTGIATTYLRTAANVAKDEEQGYNAGGAAAIKVVAALNEYDQVFVGVWDSTNSVGAAYCYTVVGDTLNEMTYTTAAALAATTPVVNNKRITSVVADRDGNWITYSGGASGNETVAKVARDGDVLWWQFDVTKLLENDAVLAGVDHRNRVVIVGTEKNDSTGAIWLLNTEGEVCGYYKDTAADYERGTLADDGTLWVVADKSGVDWLYTFELTGDNPAFQQKSETNQSIDIGTSLFGEDTGYSVADIFFGRSLVWILATKAGSNDYLASVTLNAVSTNSTTYRLDIGIEGSVMLASNQASTQYIAHGDTLLGYFAPSSRKRTTAAFIGYGTSVICYGDEVPQVLLPNRKTLCPAGLLPGRTAFSAPTAYDTSADADSIEDTFNVAYAWVRDTEGERGVVSYVSPYYEIDMDTWHDDNGATYVPRFSLPEAPRDPGVTGWLFLAKDATMAEPHIVAQMSLNSIQYDFDSTAAEVAAKPPLTEDWYRATPPAASGVCLHKGVNAAIQAFYWGGEDYSTGTVTLARESVDGTYKGVVVADSPSTMRFGRRMLWKKFALPKYGFVSTVVDEYEEFDTTDIVQKKLVLDDDLPAWMFDPSTGVVNTELTALTYAISANKASITSSLIEERFGFSGGYPTVTPLVNTAGADWQWDGDSITNVVSADGQLFVFGRRHVYVGPPQNFFADIRMVSDQYGCVADYGGGATAIGGGRVAFVGENGLGVVDSQQVSWLGDLSRSRLEFQEDYDIDALREAAVAFVARDTLLMTTDIFLASSTNYSGEALSWATATDPDADDAPEGFTQFGQGSYSRTKFDVRLMDHSLHSDYYFLLGLTADDDNDVGSDTPLYVGIDPTGACPAYETYTITILSASTFKVARASGTIRSLGAGQTDATWTASDDTLRILATAWGELTFAADDVFTLSIARRPLVTTALNSMQDDNGESLILFGSNVGYWGTLNNDGSRYNVVPWTDADGAVTLRDTHQQSLWLSKPIISPEDQGTGEKAGSQRMTALEAQVFLGTSSDDFTLVVPDYPRDQQVGWNLGSGVVSAEVVYASWGSGQWSGFPSNIGMSHVIGVRTNVTPLDSDDNDTYIRVEAVLARMLIQGH